MPNDIPAGTANATLRDVLIVAIAGGVGGLLVTAPAFTEPLTYSAWGNASTARLVVLPILFGCVAGGIGVFLLTDTNTVNKIRMFFFALVCGLSSQSVIDAGKNFVSGEAKITAANVAVKEQAHEVVQLSKAGGGPKELGERTERLLASAPLANREEVKADVARAVDATLKAIPPAGSSAEATTALTNIGIAAARANDIQNVGKVLASIELSGKSMSSTTGSGTLSASQDQAIAAIRKELPLGLQLAKPN